MILISRGIINSGQRGFYPLRYAAMEKDQLFVAVGSRIRTLRQAHGFSQEEFAAVAGLDRAYYGSIERGERNVSVRNLVRIAATLGVEVGELFPPIQALSSLINPLQSS
jgi:transcriptional regulator with XRE-family HTH domain